MVRKTSLEPPILRSFGSKVYNALTITLAIAPPVYLTLRRVRIRPETGAKNGKHMCNSAVRTTLCLREVPGLTIFFGPFGWSAFKQIHGHLSIWKDSNDWLHAIPARKSSNMYIDNCRCFCNMQPGRSK